MAPLFKCSFYLVWIISSISNIHKYIVNIIRRPHKVTNNSEHDCVANKIIELFKWCAFDVFYNNTLVQWDLALC